MIPALFLYIYIHINIMFWVWSVELRDLQRKKTNDETKSSVGFERSYWSRVSELGVLLAAEFAYLFIYLF